MSPPTRLAHHDAGRVDQRGGQLFSIADPVAENVSPSVPTPSTRIVIAAAEPGAVLVANGPSATITVSPSTSIESAPVTAATVHDSSAIAIGESCR